MYYCPLVHYIVKQHGTTGVSQQASECDEGPSMAAGNDVCVLQNLRVVDDGRRESGNWQRIWTDDSRCDVGRGVIDRYSHLFLHPFASTITGLRAYAGTHEAS